MPAEWKKYTDANRTAWNEAAPVHAKTRPFDLNEFFSKPGASLLDPTETAIMESFELEGKNVAQLCCNNGRELISIVNIGAKSGTGFDISDGFIDQGRELAKIAGAACEFVRTDVLDIGHEYDNQFDIVYISIGAIAWIPDLNAFFRIVGRLLKPGGNLLIYDMHPFTYLIPFESFDYKPAGFELKPSYSYFRKEVIAEKGLDYFGFTQYDASTHYEFPQTLSDVINSVIGAGIEITELKEYPYDIANGFKWAEKLGMFPLSYSLAGRKK